MRDYIKRRSSEATFTQKGLSGYLFNLEHKNFELYEVGVETGHDTYILSKTITHTYYILEGEGTFEIGNESINVKAKDCIEVPPGIEYTYSGKMKLLLIMTPPWFEGNEITTKLNPNVK